MTGNRHRGAGAPLSGTAAAGVLRGGIRRGCSRAARLVLAAAIVCTGAKAQAQSFYLDDTDVSPNIIRMNAPAGTDVSGITPRVISGSATIRNNVTYSLAGSSLFAVNPATGAIRSAGPFTSDNLGHYSMTLTAMHGGESASLQLPIGVHPVGGFYICDRASNIERKILEATAADDMCGFVSAAAMAGIAEINILGFGNLSPNGTLLDYNFWGMPGLRDLFLTGAGLNRLPPDIFAGLRLNNLVFYGDEDGRSRNVNLNEFPARLLADLEKSPRVAFSANPGARIGGIRYRLDGEAVAETEGLMLDEGRRYNLEIEVDGGVRSLLTLEFRGESQSPVTVMPTTISISPFSNKATVELQTSADLDFAERRLTTVFWAWRQFRRDAVYRANNGNLLRVGISSGGVNAEEIRTPDLQLTVRDPGTFEDADPMPNQISEAASEDVAVSGWSPQVLVGGNPPMTVRYSLSSDAGGLFEIDAASGVLSLVSGRTLDYTVSSSHEVTVAAQVTVSGGDVTGSLTVPIEVIPALFLRDADPVANSIAADAPPGTRVVGVTPEARFAGSVVTDGVVYSLAGPALFEVNTASGVISSARQLADGDAGMYPVTMTAVHNFGTASLPLIIEVRAGVSVCDRTPAVRGQIVSLISSQSGVMYNCNFIPSDSLAAVVTLTVPRLGLVNELLPHDFAGMRGLEDLSLASLGASSLPEGIFSNSAGLRRLNLQGSRRLELLPPDIFMNLDRLESLNFFLGGLRELPARLLADLEKPPPVTLTVPAGVRISGVQYRLDGAASLTLDEGVRHRLQVGVDGGVRSTLTLVLRAGGELALTVAPETIVFSPQSGADTAVVELRAPPDLDFADKSATVSWAWNMFRSTANGATEIRTRSLQVNVRNTETLLLEDDDPSPDTIAASAAPGTRVSGVAPAARVGRAGGAVVAAGAEYGLIGGDLFTVNTATGAISSARLFTNDDRGRHPVTLTATYRNTAASLPLVIGVHPDGGFDICGRTPVVRDEILRLVNAGGGTHDCTDVPAADLASVQALDFSAYSTTVETLLADDFQGLSGLTGLNLDSLGLRRLPPELFSGLAGLENLDLSNNGNLAELPARLLASLEKPAPVTAGFDNDVRIGDVQYRIGGAAITGLTLNEGESRNLRVEIAGGVGSTLTLVARTDGAPPPAITPPTIQFSPFSGADAVIVEVTAPTDSGNFDGSTASVSWAWMMYNAAAGAATGIRAQGLRLDVRELDRFEDIDPAANRISETASAGDLVSGWSPRVLVGGVTPEGVRYRLSSDAGGLFGIDSASGALSLVADRTLDYTVSTSHQITVAADVSGAEVPLTAAIEVLAGFVLRDTDTSANIIAVNAAPGTPVGGVAPLARLGGRVFTDDVVYSLDGPDGLFRVNTATGLVSSARLFTNRDLGAHRVTVTVVRGRDVASLPLTIEIRDGISICDRTREVRDEIVDTINRRPGGAVHNCHAVRVSDLASISTLSLSGRLNRAAALLAHDFNGMTGLEDLNLRGVAVRSLPENIFRDVTSLRVLNLGNSRFLTSLPPNIFGNLGNLETLDLSFTGFTSLPEDVFRDVTSLRVLNLGNSRFLTSLPPNIFGSLGNLENLDLSFTNFTSLPEAVFSGLPDLRVLNLGASRLTSLPPDIFRDVGSLQSLNLLFNDGLTELPARLLADLERIGLHTLNVDAGVRVGGVEYRAGGAPVTALTLNEGDSRDLLVEAADGVGSTLTLVFRSGAASRLTATPPTVRLNPSQRSAAVTLAAPPDLNLGDRSGAASWAWRFISADGGEVAIPTAGLQVTVNDTHRFEDTDPAPNRISETALPGEQVSGWSPQVVVGGSPVAAVSYRLSPDAGVFGIDAASGALSLASGQTLDYAAASSHPVTVIARVTGSGTTASLAAAIEVVPVLFFSDTDSSANVIAATAATGTPVAGVALEARFGGVIRTDGVAYRLAGPALFEVNTASGVISPARQLVDGDTGMYPVTLTATYQGTPASLPLTIDVFDGVSVCDRTPAIRDEILRLVNSRSGARYGCNLVPPARLASITTLNLSRRLDEATALLADDFGGLSGLETLDLRFLGIAVAATSLPAGIFSDLSSLRRLDLRNSRLMSLPPRLLADLEKSPPVTAGFDNDVRIGDIQYRLEDGAALTGPLTLNEGESRSLRVRVVGGVHSTLTLVLRTDGALSLTAMPEAVEFGPFSGTDTAVVELTAQPNLDFGDSGGTVSWAWEMFSPAAGGAAEIRARQDLQVSVRNTETFSFEDDDPSPNTIAVSAPPGTNVAGVAPTLRVGGVAVTSGVAYALTGSALFAVHSTSGAIFPARGLTDGDRGHYRVTLMASYRSSAGTLPLTIGVHPAGGFDICDRTPVVQREILYRVNTQAEVRNRVAGGGNPYDCRNVPAANMASVQLLNFSGYSTTVETLLAHDFEGLSGLANLVLGSLGLRRLPPEVFRNLDNLGRLSLTGNNLTSLPPQLFSGLSGLTELNLDSLNLRSLPSTVFSNLHNLGSLYLSDNRLESLPPDVFDNLISLTDLALAGNNLTSLPQGVFSDLINLADLNLARNNLTSLPRGVFSDSARLFLLSLGRNNLGSLPRDVFSDFVELQILELDGNGNLELPARAIADLERLRPNLDTLILDSSVRIGDIQYRLDGATTTALTLGEGESRHLQVKVDGGVASTLTLVLRADGVPPLAVTPTTIRFSPLSNTDTAVVELAIPADSGGFGGSTGSVSWAWTMFNADGGATTEIRAQSLRLDVREPDVLVLRDADPSANTIAATAATGTRVAGVMPVARILDDILTDGVVYSLAAPGLFTINTASGAISSARQFTNGDAGAYPVTMTASHRRSVASLPLTIEVRSGVSICDRTPAVQREILRLISSQSGVLHNCDLVPPAGLAAISTLVIPRGGTATLLAHDFDGMPTLANLILAYLDISSLPEGIFRNTTGLRVLNLEGSNLASFPPNLFMNLGGLVELNLGGLAVATTSLPEVIFSGLSNLRTLHLYESNLESLPPDIFMNLGRLETLQLSLNDGLDELPARLLADLEKLPSVGVGVDPGVRVGGLRYLLDGATTTAITLNEGGSRDLQVEAVGGVRSTLTLVFRPGAESRLTATPTTIRLIPSRSTAAVTLAAPPDLNTGDRSGPVWWAWTGFGGAGNRAIELPTPDLSVTVRDTHRFEDANPAPNRIGETAPADVAVSGWSPRVLVGGVTGMMVRYSLSSDAGGLFEIDPASGALSLVSGRRLNHAMSPSHGITVVAQVTDSGTTASLAVTIEVFPLALEDADPSANAIAATAAPGTPVSGVAPVLLVDGAAVADGVFYTLTGSDLFTVSTASGGISSARALGGAGGSHPVTLTATYQGAPADLPLTIAVHAGAGRHICDRTPVVQREILYRVNTQAEVRNRVAGGGTPYDCSDIPATNMASVQTLDFSGYSTTVETLLAYDFEGLSGLTSLNLRALGLRRLPQGVFSGLVALINLSLRDNALTSLPRGIFSGLPLASLSLVDNSLTSLPADVFSDSAGLRVLELEGNDNLELPAPVVADLEGLRLDALEIGGDARIGGFRYHAAPPHSGEGDIQRFQIEERERRNLWLEAVGGVRSTLTLVLRVDLPVDDRQFTVTPPTIRFSPLSNTDTAVVELTAPLDEAIDTPSSRMSWVWTMFNANEGAATEIRTQSLRVNVADSVGLVDANPADNRISEAATAGTLVSGWLPRASVDGVILPALRYRLSPGADNLFEIDSSGALSLASGRMLDYETATAHTVRVLAEVDRNSGAWPLTTTIFVDNVPELSLSGVVTGSISEAAATGTEVSGIGVSLLDDGVLRTDRVVYELRGAGSSPFDLTFDDSGAAGLELINSALLDYETVPVHTLTLRVSYLGESVTTQITVHVLNAVETVTLEAAGTTPYRIGENAGPGVRVGAVMLLTEDGTRLVRGVTYTLAGSELFAVTTAGDIVVAGQLDYEASTLHTLLITAAHEGMASNPLRVDVAIVDIPGDLQIVDQSGVENIASNTTGGQVRGLDLVFQIDGVNQSGAASSWRLGGGAGLFDINSATGAITLRRRLDAVPADYTVTVAATWTGGDGVPADAPPLPLNIRVDDGVPVRIRVFLEGAVIP